jgi:hypothetical protein
MVKEATLELGGTVEEMGGGVVAAGVVGAEDVEQAVSPVINASPNTRFKKKNLDFMNFLRY